MTPLLVVTDSFVARGPGVLVMPRIVVTSAPPAKLRLRLRTPDGAERVVDASIDLAHMRGPQGQYGMYRLHGITPNEAPAGTEIFAE
jgi:hypothetical protein